MASRYRVEARLTVKVLQDLPSSIASIILHVLHAVPVASTFVLMGIQVFQLLVH